MDGVVREVKARVREKGARMVYGGERK